MKVEYRKREGSDTWHWCSNCSKWPSYPDKYEVWCGTGRPSSGELCDEGRRKERKDKCEKKRC